MMNARCLQVTTPLLVLLAAACSGPPAPAPSAHHSAYIEPDPEPDPEPVPDVCGDGARTGAEQCDDGNLVNLDGCDGACRFEQAHRANALTMQFGKDASCARNALGGAIASVAQSTLQSSLSTGISDGSISIVFALLGLGDLSGSDGPAQIGVLNATPVAGAGYNGNADLDWWYSADPAALDANRVPLQQLSGSVVNHQLTASGPALSLSLVLAGSVAQLVMRNVLMTAYTGTPPTAPTLSASGTTPGHLASENLDPALTSFATTGGASGTDTMCGDITAASLAKVPAPPALVQGGATPCIQGYSSANSLLDVLVGGCSIRVIFFPITAITPTQPDTPGADTYIFALGADKKVASCTQNGAAADVAACLDAASYSSYFQFTSDRVIVK
jgi:cysteine-rich repeat protein